MLFSLIPRLLLPCMSYTVEMFLLLTKVSHKLCVFDNNKHHFVDISLQFYQTYTLLVSLPRSLFKTFRHFICKFTKKYVIL